ncbi:Transmembrane protein, partial [Phytophthora palmivora]
MKLVGKKEQAYASLDMESPHATPTRRSNSNLSNVQLSPSGASTISISSERSNVFSSHDNVQPFYNNVANDILAALDGPVRQLAFETKGALLATGWIGCGLLLIGMVPGCADPILSRDFSNVSTMYLVDPLVEVIDVSPKYFLCVCTSRGRHARRKS